MRRHSSPVGEERRGLAIADAGIDIRDAIDGAKRFFGHAAVFNVRTAIGNPLKWGFYEQVAPGTFTKTISEGDARMLIDHDSYYVVSRVSADTLNLAQDARGLATDSALDQELSYVRDLQVNLRNRNITGMSFGFRTVKDEWDVEEVQTSDGNTAEVEVRTILEVKLIEVSAVTFPAYEETTAGLRHSLVPALLQRGDAEAIKRAATHRPDLADLLGYDADLAPTVLDLGDAMAKARTADQTSTPPAGEPGESTHRADDSTTSTDTAAEEVEPVASTRHAPMQHELAAARLRELSARLRRTA